MKIEDGSQNLTFRIAVIQIIGLIVLALLGVRLYYLQIVRGEEYAKRAESQRIRQIRIPAPRGAIFDRYGRMLVDSRMTYNIILSRELTRGKDLFTFIEPLSRGLAIEPDFLRSRLEWIKKQPEFESIIVKENATIEDISWVEAHALEFPEVSIEQQPQRYYPNGTSLAHVLGYVGEINPKQIESYKAKGKIFRPGDVIGIDGLENTYDEYLRGRDGYREVLVDSRGRFLEQLKVVPPQAGQDLYTTIDLDLQKKAEEMLANSSTKRGVIISMEPNTGEILVLASAPSYDPNAFVTRSSTPEGRAEIAAFYTDPQKPLVNRATRGRYFPGSTWKIPLSVGGFETGVIDEKNNSMLCGGGIRTGSKFTRCMGNHGSPPLHTAISYSCDGYYYRLALAMKVEGLIKMVETFEFDKPTGIDLPRELTTRTPKYWKPFVDKRPGGWKEVDTVFSSIGQVYVEATPISMLRAVASIAVGGKLFVPHLLKEFRSMRAVGDFPERPAVTFSHPEPKIIALTEEQHNIMEEGMIGAVNFGTAQSVKIPNFQIAGKTGTAQVAGLGKDVGANKDHAWFISYAPAHKPEIAVLALIENSGFGGRNAAPAARGVYETYLAKGGLTPNSPTPTETETKGVIHHGPAN